MHLIVCKLRAGAQIPISANEAKLTLKNSIFLSFFFLFNKNCLSKCFAVLMFILLYSEKQYRVILRRMSETELVYTNMGLNHSQRQ